MTECYPSPGNQLEIVQIVAMSENRVIGRDGDMPWRISADFKFFKQQTMGCPLVMGRKTHESIGRALPGRHTIVVTRDPSHPRWIAEGVAAVGSLDEAWALCEEKRHAWGDKVFVAGGGEIYRQAMPFTQRILLTQVHRQVEGDTVYPEVPGDFVEVSRRSGEDDTWPFSWRTLERKAQH